MAEAAEWIDSMTDPCHLGQNLVIWLAASHGIGIRPHVGAVPGQAWE